MYHQGKMPTGLENLLVRAKRLAVLAVCEPTLEPLKIQLKYAPWRSSLEHASRARFNTKRPQPTTCSVQQQAHMYSKSWHILPNR